jgi:betaine reductase
LTIHHKGARDVSQEQDPRGTLCAFAVSFEKETRGRRLEMNLAGKKVIVLGERDGVQGTALSECAKAAGGEVVLAINQCFV